MPQPNRREILILKDSAALAREGAQRFVALAQNAIAARGRFSVALSGGSTPRLMHQLLAAPPLAGQVDWNNIHIFWGDERFVPPSDPESTLHMARETLLDYVPIPAKNIYSMPTVGLTPEEAAQHYTETLTGFFAAGTPRFDLIFLGIGPDGHTASLFPGFPEVIAPSDKLVAVVTDSPKPPPTRLTLTYKTINNAASVIFLVGGSGKAGVVAAILSEQTASLDFPAGNVRPVNGALAWLLDEDAAQFLKK